MRSPLRFGAVLAALLFASAAVVAPAEAANTVDLKVTNAGRVPQSRPAGTDVTLAVEARATSARGVRIPGTLTVSLYLSGDAARGGDALLARQSIPSSVLGRPGPFAIKGRIPANTSTRNYRILACVTAAVTDPNLSNNCRVAAGVMRVTAPTPPPTPPPTPAGVVLVGPSAVSLPSHHFAAGTYDNPSLTSEVVVRNIGKQTTGPLLVEYPVGVTENCGLGNSSPCKDLDPEPCQGATLATNETCSMLLAFEPDRIATLDGIVTVRDRTLLPAAQTPARIRLTGQTSGGAYFSVGGINVDFPSGVADFTRFLEVGVENIGSEAAAPGQPVVAFPSAFLRVEVQSHSCAVLLAPGESCALQIRVSGQLPSGMTGPATGTIRMTGPSGVGQIRVNVYVPE